MRNTYFGLLFIVFLSITSSGDLAGQSPSTSPAPTIYFLTQAVTITMQNHDYSFGTGTQFELVQDLGDRLRVKNGDFQFDIDRALVTSDLVVAKKTWEAEVQEKARQQNEFAQAVERMEARRVAARDARRLEAENAITPAEAKILNLRDVHRDISGNIIYGVATDGISVGSGQARSFEEQLRLVQSGMLPKETAAEAQQEQQRQAAAAQAQAQFDWQQAAQAQWAQIKQQAKQDSSMGIFSAATASIPGLDQRTWDRGQARAEQEFRQVQRQAELPVPGIDPLNNPFR